jgi:hypothetical protein
MVEVKGDPRSPMTKEDRMGIKKALDEHALLVKEAKTSFDKLIDAKKSVNIVEKLLENQPDTIKKSFKEIHKNLNSQLDSLINQYVGPENVKGIQRNPDQLNSVLFGAANYIRSSWSAPKENAQLAVEKAKVLSQNLNNKVANFLTTEWVAYQEKVKTLEVKIFK